MSCDFMIEVNKIIQGHTLNILKRNIDSNSINCVITSPPYWALRDYKTEGLIWDGNKNCEHEFTQNITKNMGGGSNGIAPKYNEARKYSSSSSTCNKCGAWKGSLGLEPSFNLYIKHLCDIFDEVKRVLRKDGTLWVNLGDTYGNTSGGMEQLRKQGKFTPQYGAIPYADGYDGVNQSAKKHMKLEKSLCMIPFRFAIEMQNRGWILRNVIIWHKPNCMPSSASDRFTVDFEYVFFFVKSKRYWFEQQLEPQQEISIKRAFATNHLDARKDKEDNQFAISMKSQNNEFDKIKTQVASGIEPTRNKRCVWTINTQPFSESHFAVFPETLVEPMIKAGCPEFVCTKCGKAREKIIESVGYHFPEKDKTDKHHVAGVTISSYKSGPDFAKFKAEHPDKFIGYSSCSCNACFSSGIVMDIFAGSGTTCKVAKDLGRQYIGIELNPDYVKLANERVNGFERKDWQSKRENKSLSEILYDKNQKKLEEEWEALKLKVSK